MMVPDRSQNLAARVPPFATEDLHGERRKRADPSAMAGPNARFSPQCCVQSRARYPPWVRPGKTRTHRGIERNRTCKESLERTIAEKTVRLIRIPPSNHRRRAPTCAVSRADPLAVGQMGDLFTRERILPKASHHRAKSEMPENAVECAVRGADPRPSRALTAQNAWSRNSRTRFRARRVHIRPCFLSSAVWAECSLKVWAGFLRKTSRRHGGGSARAVARVVCRRIGHRDHQLADGTAAGSKRARLRLDAQLERLGEPQRALRVEPLVEAAPVPDEVADSRALIDGRETARR